MAPEVEPVAGTGKGGHMTVGPLSSPTAVPVTRTQIGAAGVPKDGSLCATADCTGDDCTVDDEAAVGGATAVGDGLLAAVIAEARGPVSGDVPGTELWTAGAAQPATSTVATTIAAAPARRRCTPTLPMIT